MKLKEQLYSVISQYIDIFCDKQEVELDSFVNDDMLGIALVSDFYLNISDIVFDIDNEVEKGKIFKWYYASIDADTNPFPNYKNYLKLQL